MLLILLITFAEVRGATYYLKANAATSPQTLSSWGDNTDGTGNSPSSFIGHDLIIPSNVNAELSSSWTVSSSSNVNASLNVNGSLVILTGGAITISQGGNASVTVIVNNGGVLDLRNTSAAQISAGSSKNQSVTIADGATLKVAHQTGITSSISSTTANPIAITLSASANYEFSGATQTTGGLPTTVNNLTFSGSGTKSLGNAQTISGNLSIDSGVTFAAGAQSVTVTGNWSNSGTFTSTGTVTFNRNTAGQTQTISGSEFHSVSMTGASGKSASGNLTLTGNLSITAGSAFTAGAHTHSVAGNWSQSGTFTAGTSTIVFNGGNTTQTISGTNSFNNLTILKSSGGTVTAAGSTLAVGNILHISAGNFTGASSYNHVTIASGATFTAGAGTSTVSGNWINNGTFVANNGTISFIGVAANDSVQLIGGTNSTTFHGLTMNGTRLKRLDIATTATGTLTMSVGILEILSFSLTVAQTAGGSASSYVMTSGTGRLSVTIPATASSFFPVGNSAYNPMQLTNQSTTQTEVFRVRVSDSPATNANDVTKTVQRRWYVSKITAGNTPVQVVLYYNENTEEGASFNKTVTPAVGYYSGLYWAYETILPEQVITNGDVVSFTAAGTINNSNEESFMVVGSGSAFNATKFHITVSPTSPQLGAGGGIIAVSSINDQGIPTWLKTATTVRVDPVNITDQELENRATGFTTPLTTNYAEGIIAVNSYMIEFTEVSFVVATTESGGPSQLSASVVTTDPLGESLATSLSAPFTVISGAIYEPTVSGNWTSIVWRKSVDGGLSWVLSNDPNFGFAIPTTFNATELVRIPDGITLTANITATFYSFYIETGGELDIVTGGALTLLHPDGNLSGYDLHVHGIFRNSGGTFFNKDYGDTTDPDPQTAEYPNAVSGATYPIEMHGGTYIHARNGGSIPLAEWESLGEIRSHCIVTGITTTALISGLNQQFEDFTWNNSGQTVVQSLNGNLQVQGNLTLSNGVLTTGVHKVIKSGSGVITRSGGHIHGNFRYYVPTGEAVSVNFPVGDASVYAPVDISFSNISGNGYVDVSTVAAQPTVASAIRQDQYVNRKWTMNSNGLDFTGYSPTFTFAESDRVGLTEASVLTVRRLSNSIWYTTGASSVTNSITANGLTSFSDFYVGVSACSETNYFWLGSVDSDWHTAANWCRNAVPTSTTDVTIPGGIIRYPVISTAASVFNLWILSESTLTVQGTPELSVYGDWSNQGTFAAGSGMVTFAGAASQQIIGVTNFHHLTIDNPSGGVEAQNNITVNGILNALSANPSTTKGALHTGSHVLYMGATATNTGAGDVTGTITRNHPIQLNTFYTFGHAYTGSRFLVGVELPTSISLRVSIGNAPGWVGKSLKRTYEPSQVGGVNMRVYSKFHYQENELPAGITSVEESTLSVWLKTPVDENNFIYIDRGWSDYDIAENWVAISDDNFTTLPSSIGDLVITLAPTANPIIVWEGSVSSDWNDVNNWSGDDILPTQDDIVIIPDSTTTIHVPVLPSSAGNAQAKALVVQAGGVLEGGSGQLTIFNGNVANAWQLETARLSFDAAVFNAGTSTIVFNSQTTFATISGNTTFYSLEIPAGSKALIGDDAYVGITGALLLDANGILDAASTHNFVEYKGDNQLIVNPNYDSFPGYHNLTISGSGVKTLPSVLNMTCNFTNNGTVDALLNQSNIIFNTGVHNKPMLIKGSTPTTFHKLTVNNLHGVTAQQDLTIANELSLQTMNLSNIRSASY